MNWITTIVILGIYLLRGVAFAQTKDVGISIGYGTPMLSWPSHTPLARGAYAFETTASFGAEFNWIPRHNWGFGTGLLNIEMRGASDSVDVQTRFKYYYSEINIRCSALYVPLQVFYRIPVKKLMFQLSAAVMPGFLYERTLTEKQIPTSPLYTYKAFYLEYDGFELGVMGEARIAYEITPGLYAGGNVRYFRSGVDMKGYTGGTSSSSITQFSQAFFFALSANWSLVR